MFNNGSHYANGNRMVVSFCVSIMLTSVVTTQYALLKCELKKQ